MPRVWYRPVGDTVAELEAALAAQAEQSTPQIFVGMMATAKKRVMLDTEDF